MAELDERKCNCEHNEKKLTPKDYHDARVAITSEGIRAALTLNGGAAIALLAFLQSVWDANPPLARLFLAGIGIFSIGATLAGVANFLRYKCSFAHQFKIQPDIERYCSLSKGCQYYAMFLFPLGCYLLVLCGMWMLSKNI